MATKKFRIDGVFDVETHKWKHPVVAGIWTPEDGYEYVWGDFDSYVDKLLAKPRDLWGWNCGNYDDLFVVDNLLARGYEAPIEPVFTGARVVSITLRGTRLIDTMGLIPFSLDKAGEMVGHHKTSLDFPCDCGRGCGGYCYISLDMPPWARKRLIEYLENDLVLNYKVVTYFLDYLRDMGWVEELTLGMSAWSTAKKLFDLPPAKWKNKRDYQICAKAFFGGRVGIFKHYSPQGYCYDMNSAYPSVMTDVKIPLGNGYETLLSTEASHAFDAGREGVFQVRVSVPESVFAPLPLRNRAQSRIEYPYGDFTGYWSGLELRNAIEHGTKISKVYSAIVWPDVEVDAWFGPLMELMFSERKRVGKKTVLGELVKRWACSIYGKMGQNPSRDVIVGNPDMASEVAFCPGKECWDSPRYCALRNNEVCCVHKCNRLCGTLRPYGRSNNFFTRRVYTLSSCCHVGAGLYITSAVRARLYNATMAAGLDDLVLIDTDCNYRENEFPQHMIGQALGLWDRDCAYKDLFAVAPKLYCCLTDSDKEPERVRSRGIPLKTVQEFMAYTGNDLEYVPDSTHPYLKALHGPIQEAATRPIAAVYDRGLESMRSALAKGQGLVVEKYVERSHGKARLTHSRHITDIAAENKDADE